MMSLDFLGLGLGHGRRLRVPFRIAIPAFGMPERKTQAPVPKGALSREEVTAVFADVIGPDASWTDRERQDQALAARIRAAIYS